MIRGLAMILLLCLLLFLPTTAVMAEGRLRSENVGFTLLRFQARGRVGRLTFIPYRPGRVYYRMVISPAGAGRNGWTAEAGNTGGMRWA